MTTKQTQQLFHSVRQTKIAFDLGLQPTIDMFIDLVERGHVAAAQDVVGRVRTGLEQFSAGLGELEKQVDGASSDVDSSNT